MEHVQHIKLFLSFQMFCSVFRPSVFANWHSLKLDFYPPTVTGRKELYLPRLRCLWDGLQVFGKDIPASHKTRQRLLKDLDTSQKERENLQVFRG